tara:strand:+ start:6924 stop:7280 length:357 start_codon:yes stop_codon:yes gene_type:complete
MVARLSKLSLQKILSGQIKDAATIAVKFYANRCHFCHALKDSYESLSSEYDDVLFFAFNMEDYPDVGRILNFEGVPTICLMKVGNETPRIRVMSEPEEPHPDTWYSVPNIKTFIEKEK